MSETTEKKSYGYKAVRNTENGRYYYISNPTEKNLYTHNFCIKWSFLKYPSKDFLFEWTNPDTGKVEKKVLNPLYVKKHAFPRYRWRDKLDHRGMPVINEKTGKVVKERDKYICHMISYQWIDRYEKLVASRLAPAPMYPLA